MVASISAADMPLLGAKLALVIYACLADAISSAQHIAMDRAILSLN